MTEKKIVLITGPQTIHRYFSRNLNHRFPLAGIFVEDSNYPQPPPATEEERAAWEWFFTRRKAYEAIVFKCSNKLAAKNIPKIYEVPQGGINSNNCVEKIKKLQPDLIALFGSSILREEALDFFPQNIFNLHVGLADKYRGSSCNFWPIYDRSLSHLGATIIRVNRGIDSGETLARDTICLENNDDEQSLIAKTIILGTALMIDTIQKWMDGTLESLAPSNQGKLFLQKDFTPKAILKVKKMVDENELQEIIKSGSIREKNQLP